MYIEVCHGVSLGSKGPPHKFPFRKVSVTYSYIINICYIVKYQSSWNHFVSGYFLFGKRYSSLCMAFVLGHSKKSPHIFLPLQLQIWSQKISGGHCRWPQLFQGRRTSNQEWDLKTPGPINNWHVFCASEYVNSAGAVVVAARSSCSSGRNSHSDGSDSPSCLLEVARSSSCSSSSSSSSVSSSSNSSGRSSSRSSSSSSSSCSSSSSRSSVVVGVA